MAPDLPEQNRRIKELIRHFSDGNVAAFSETLDDVSYQSLNRLFNIDSRSHKYPGVSSDIIKAITTQYPSINIDWLMHGKGPMLKAGDESTSVTAKNFTPDQLFAMFLEVTKSQTAILNNIESKMAQESTQAIIKKAVEKIETNLNKVLEAQVGHSAMFGLLLNRDVLREAGGNQEIAQEILKEILQKFGSKLNSDLKEGIGADGGNQDMKSS